MRSQRNLLLEAMTPQCSPYFRSVSNKINYLLIAVISKRWPRTSTINIVTAHYTLKSFVTALRESRPLEEENKSAKISETKTQSKLGFQPGTWAESRARQDV